MWTILSILACSPECPPGSARNGAGLCELFPEDSGSPTADTADRADTDTDTDTAITLSVGDPIVELGSTYSAGSSRFDEWVDAVVLNDTEAVAVGVSGTALINIQTFEIVSEYPTNRAYRIDADPDSRIAVAGTIGDGLRRIDLDSGDTIRKNSGPDEVGHDDVSISGQVIMVAWRSEGVYFLDTQLNTISIVPATSANAAIIRGDRALYSDAEELVLLDVSDPAAPTELDRIPIPADGVDLDFDGERIALSMGGRGVALYTLQGDTIAEAGALSTPGTAQGVALDGDYLWIGSWEVTALAWLGDGGPVVVGHEDPQYSAMAVGAKDGTALVADWFSATVLQRVDGVAGPELQIPEQLTVHNSAELTIVNHGAFPLDFEITQTHNGYTASPEAVSLEPGAGQVITITPPSGNAPNSQMSWESNDPDEPSGELRLMSPTNGVGTQHDDFELLGFTWPDTTLTSYRLSDYKGKAVFLAYWADF